MAQIFKSPHFFQNNHLTVQNDPPLKKNKTTKKKTMENSNPANNRTKKKQQLSENFFVSFADISILSASLKMFKMFKLLLNSGFLDLS
jgi:hypothetical protein